MGYINCDIPKEKCNARGVDSTCKLNIKCLPVVGRCEGTDDSEETGGRECARVDNGFCTTYYKPESKWVADRYCPLATHYETEEEKARKKRVGQQKQRRWQ